VLLVTFPRNAIVEQDIVNVVIRVVKANHGKEA